MTDVAREEIPRKIESLDHLLILFPFHLHYMIQSGMLDQSDSMCEITFNHMDERKDWGPWRLFFRGEKWFYWVSSPVFWYRLISMPCQFLYIFMDIWSGHRASRWAGGKKSCQRNALYLSHLGLHGRQTNTKQFPTKLPAGVAVEMEGKSERTEGALNSLCRSRTKVIDPARVTSPCCDWHGQDEITPDHEDGMK